jgi:hypothetical protein
VSKAHAAASPSEAVRSGPWPTAIKWKIQTMELVVRNTCPYDAALAALMHIPAEGTQAFIESRVEHDAQLRELARARELFWSGSVTEASAPRCLGHVGQALVAVLLAGSCALRRCSVSTGPPGAHAAVRTAA